MILAMKYYSFFILLAVLACNQQNNQDNQEEPSMKVVNDTINLERTSVNSAPVASYSEKVKDPLNDWKFAVDVYETKATFDFLVKMKYKELEAEDSITIPNFGIEPKVEIRKGDKEQSCIIGFLDKNKEFKSYKLVQITNKQLKISTLRHYARTRYKVK
ncbi:hypothetical protein [Dyadobacter sediminis]|nr:hypothetical protein [Dyadobacter sediminis]GGB91384.1 hypothetical protein GCM10011325_18550 [Dyadobacter sediminis]